jgi:hypothetical protein
LDSPRHKTESPLPARCTSLSFSDYFEPLHRRAREIHRESGRAQIAAELLAKQVLDIGLVVNDENERVQ